MLKLSRTIAYPYFSSFLEKLDICFVFLFLLLSVLFSQLVKKDVHDFLQSLFGLVQYFYGASFSHITSFIFYCRYIFRCHPKSKARRNHLESVNDIVFNPMYAL